MGRRRVPLPGRIKCAGGACREPPGARLRALVARLLRIGHARADPQMGKSFVEHTVAMKIDLLAIRRLEKAKFPGRIDADNRAGLRLLVLLGLPLDAADLILQLPALKASSVANERSACRGSAEGLWVTFTSRPLGAMCGPDSQKAANLARDDRVSLTIDHDSPQVMQITGLSMAAHAHVVVDAAEAQKALHMLMAKYPPQGDLMPTPADVRIFRVTPAVISVLDYTKGFGHTDLVSC